jgi:hypothetical protein
VGILKAGWCRKRLTASPEQPGFLKLLRARGNDAAWGRATCSSRTSQRPGAWIVRNVRIVGVVRVVRIVAGIARAEDEVAEVGEVGDEERTVDVCGVGDEGLRPHWWGLGA